MDGDCGAVRALRVADDFARVEEPARAVEPERAEELAREREEAVERADLPADARRLLAEAPCFVFFGAITSESYGRASAMSSERNATTPSTISSPRRQVEVDA